jgi:(S)-ureidoglycine-glyoxylate aminotransferase
LGEGLDAGFARHRLASSALRAGLQAMGLELFGDPANRMANVTGVCIPEACGNGEAVRAEMLNDFGIEIGTSFGHLAGKIWRIGTMGHVCRKPNILRCLGAFEAVLRRNGYVPPAHAGIDAAYAIYQSDGGSQSRASLSTAMDLSAGARSGVTQMWSSRRPLSASSQSTAR